MKMKIILLLSFFMITAVCGAQSETATESTNVENELLYQTSWKLVKMEPAFSQKVEAVLTFDKTAKELKIKNQVSSVPVLKGTNLVTTKTENIDFYQWGYKAVDAEYNGDDVTAMSYDYSAIELKREGYEFKIVELTGTNLTLEVVKAPKAIFGSSLADVKKIYLTK